MKSKTCFLILVSFIMFFSGCVGSSPSKTVKEFYSAIDHGNISKATGLFSNRVIQTFGLSKLQQTIEFQLKAVENSGGIDSIEIIDEQIFGDTALVNIEVTYGNGNVIREDVQLVKEDGNWKIDISK